MDAIRLSDHTPVMMKRVYSTEFDGDYEHHISEYVSSPAQLRDPDNHCIPTIEVLRAPHDADHVILVMPLLREWKSPRFDTIGEALDMIRQAFKVRQPIYYLVSHLSHVLGASIPPPKSHCPPVTTRILVPMSSNNSLAIVQDGTL